MGAAAPELVSVLVISHHLYAETLVTVAVFVYPNALALERTISAV